MAWDGTWMTTASGGRFNLTDPWPEDVRPSDIAPVLARILRFGGHQRAVGDRWWTVLDHSLLVHRLAVADPGRPTPSLLVHALLHDAHEAYIGDITTPLANALGTEARIELRRIKRDVQFAIYAGLGVFTVSPGAWPAMREMIRRWDQRALEIEAQCFLPHTEGWPSMDPVSAFESECAQTILDMHPHSKVRQFNALIDTYVSRASAAEV